MTLLVLNKLASISTFFSMSLQLILETFLISLEEDRQILVLVAEIEWRHVIFSSLVICIK